MKSLAEIEKALVLVGGWGGIQHIFLCPFSFYGLSAFSINLGMVAEGKKPAVPKE